MPNCGEVDGAVAGLRCHGLGATGACTLVRAEVVRISEGAACRLSQSDERERERVRPLLVSALNIAENASTHARNSGNERLARAYEEVIPPLRREIENYAAAPPVGETGDGRA